MMPRPWWSFRSRRFLVRIFRQTSLDLKVLQVHLNGHAAARSCGDAAQLWDSLRTVGLSDIKVDV
jgi:hypothetical protein